jgi:hypothetical protein
MEAHPSSVLVSKEGCSVLATLSRSDTYRQIVMSSGGLDVSLAAVQAFRSDADVVDSALRLFSELANIGAPQRRRLVDAGLLPVLITVLKLHSGKPTLAVSVANIVQVLVGTAVCRISAVWW